VREKRKKKRESLTFAATQKLCCLMATWPQGKLLEVQVLAGFSNLFNPSRSLFFRKRVFRFFFSVTHMTRFAVSFFFACVCVSVLVAACFFRVRKCAKKTKCLRRSTRTCDQRKRERQKDKFVTNECRAAFTERSTRSCTHFLGITLVHVACDELGFGTACYNACNLPGVCGPCVLRREKLVS
jgi:hypothetical protein